MVEHLIKRIDELNSEVEETQRRLRVMRELVEEQRKVLAVVVESVGGYVTIKRSAVEKCGLTLGVSSDPENDRLTYRIIET